MGSRASPAPAPMHDSGSISEQNLEMCTADPDSSLPCSFCRVCVCLCVCVCVCVCACVRVRTRA